jgi:DNA-binding GntR family transcriptional regulator
MNKRSSLSKDAQVYHLIKEALLDRKLSPGQKIIYRDFEEMFEMSKTPIINALVRLEHEGLVVSHRNRGFYVRDLKAKEIVQMYDLRVRLEEIAIDYGIDNGQEKDLIHLKKALDDYLAYPSDFYDAQRFKLDTVFHLGIAQMGENSFLISMLGQFYQSVWIGLNIVLLSPLIPSFRQDHEMLYQAIERRDRIEAKRIMKLHEERSLEVAKGQFPKMKMGSFRTGELIN